MNESHQLTVPKDRQGQRLDQFLQSQLPDRSRAFLQKLIADGHVTVNGVSPGKASYGVRNGDCIAVRISAPRTLETAPEAIPLAILFEDDDLIVINKSAGMVVHPAVGNFAGTLVNALLHHCRGSLAGIGGVERPGIVHRLDKGTSGCIVVAKTDRAHQSLVSQFKSRTVTKIYRAICTGRFERQSGRVETVIGRSERDRKKMSARTAHGRPAVTDYRVLKQETDCALVQLQIHTGRTHQIRVHLAHLGHPVVGDAVYGRRVPAASPDRPLAISIDRPLLHAYKLAIHHPRTGARLELTAPLPDDMKHYDWPD